MFPRDVAVHLLQVGVKVLLSSRFGARWRGDEEKLLSLCLDVAVQKMLLVLQSAAECCPEVAGCYRSCRSHVCAALEDGAGHMYVLLGVEKLSSNCKCCPGENKCAAQLWGDKEWDKKNKIKEMDKLLNFRDDPTTKIKTAISFCMYLQTG
jgi:hypothetical protein